jgi:hypothetical protein
MHRIALIAGVVALHLMLAACASAVPPSRIGEYVGPQTASGSSTLPALPRRAARAGLVVVPDTTAPDAAPTLPDEALVRLAETLQQRFDEALPIRIETIIPGEGIGPGRPAEQLSELGKRYGADYLVLVVVSSTEQEYPMTIFLGWTTHSQPGYRRDNYSLMEAALVDVKTGETLLRAEGRGWATLDRPTAPGINQWYPVIWLRPQDPVRRIWPPSYAGAPNTLRVVAMNEAAKRLVPNFQEAWIQKRQTEWQTAQR